jgi:putative N6-adenine-specific DNA methylase
MPRAAVAAGDALPAGLPRDELTPILLADRVIGAVEAATGNAGRAGVARRVRIVHAPFAELEPPARTGLVIFNPPWGDRVDGQDARAVFGSLGDVLRRHWRGWRYAVLCPDARLVGAAGLATTPTLTFPSGGKRVSWFVGSVG